MSTPGFDMRTGGVFIVGDVPIKREGLRSENKEF